MATPEAALGELCERLRSAGLDFDRAALFLGTLHPQYAGIEVRWTDGSAERFVGGFDIFEDPQFLDSPVAPIVNGIERTIRQRIEPPNHNDGYPILRDLAKEGLTDYLIFSLPFSDGSHNAMSVVTRRPGGFTDHDLSEIDKLRHPIATVSEIFHLQRTAENLMNAYVGPLSSRRVLAGQIQRGDSELIDAVIWFSDLRNSTHLGETLDAQAFLHLLNDYFEATAGAVIAHGGEVLRFIGDASLAVFPVPAQSDRATARRAACEAALAAAVAAEERAQNINQIRRANREPVFHYGVGLHLGEVLYGNIGTPERVEFSVIGAAANLAARIEGLTKTAKRALVVSNAVAAELPNQPWESLGNFALPGVADEVSLFGLDAT